jgi:hypothetical protein
LQVVRRGERQDVIDCCDELTISTAVPAGDRVLAVAVGNVRTILPQPYIDVVRLIVRVFELDRVLEIVRAGRGKRDLVAGRDCNAVRFGRGAEVDRVRSRGVRGGLVV